MFENTSFNPLDWFKSLSGGGASQLGNGGNTGYSYNSMTGYGAPSTAGTPGIGQSSVATPGAFMPGGDALAPGGATGSCAGTQLGFNTGTGQLAMGGLQTLGNLWNAFQSNALANKTFNFQKNLANTNLTNQTQAYNTNLTGMADARFAQENKTPAQALDFVNANKLAQKTL